MNDLHTLYEQYLANERDSAAHKAYMLNSDACFLEWVEEHHPSRIDEI